MNLTLLVQVSRGVKITPSPVTRGLTKSNGDSQGCMALFLSTGGGKMNFDNVINTPDSRLGPNSEYRKPQALPLF